MIKQVVAYVMLRYVASNPLRGQVGQNGFYLAVMQSLWRRHDYKEDNVYGCFKINVNISQLSFLNYYYLAYIYIVLSH